MIATPPAGCTFDDPNGLKDLADSVTARAGSTAERLAGKLAATLAATEPVDTVKDAEHIATDIDEMIERVLLREGRDKYTNYPSDAGGPTKWGVTQGALAEWRGHPVTAMDVQMLGKDEAVQIYRERYMRPFEKIRHPAMRELCFDFGVNSGPSRCILAIQTVLKRIGYYSGDLDGGYGPKTEAAIERVQNDAAFFYAVKCERLEAYLRYGGAVPSQVIFFVGWANRNDQIEMQFAQNDTGAGPNVA